MDLHNNVVGREIGKIHRHSRDEQIAKACIAALNAGRVKIL